MQALEDRVLHPILLLTVSFVPFIIPLATLYLLGAPWWVSVPLALILSPYVRSFLFGPPCRCHRHRGKNHHPRRHEKSKNFSVSEEPQTPKDVGPKRLSCW